MEPYVQWLFRRCGCYDSVGGSFRYKIFGRDLDSPDVIVQHDGTTVFVEVKLAEAPVGLRQADKATVEKTLELTAKFVHQWFLRRSGICGGNATPDMGARWDRAFGLVVVHEDSYAVREDIYLRCFERHPELPEKDRELIRRRISLVGLYSVEQFCYCHRNIIPALESRMHDAVGSESILLDTDFLKGGNADYPFDEEFIPLAHEIPRRLFAPD